jgi:hypothetical protein
MGLEVGEAEFSDVLPEVNHALTLLLEGVGGDLVRSREL